MTDNTNEQVKPFIAAAVQAYWLLAWTWQSHLTGQGKPFDMSIFTPEARNMMTNAERNLFDALLEIEQWLSRRGSEKKVMQAIDV
jgi:hypothetical protein